MVPGGYSTDVAIAGAGIAGMLVAVIWAAWV